MRFLINLDNGFMEHGTFIHANSKEEALQIFKTDPAYRIFRGEKIISIESEFEAGCWLED